MYVLEVTRCWSSFQLGQTFPKTKLGGQEHFKQNVVVKIHVVSVSRLVRHAGVGGGSVADGLGYFPKWFDK